MTIKSFNIQINDIFFYFTSDLTCQDQQDSTVDFKVSV